MKTETSLNHETPPIANVRLADGASNSSHRLKTINPYFRAVWAGEKTFEMRKNDRMFICGDEIYLREYDAENDTYSGREVRAEITYILRNFGELKDFVIFSFKITQMIERGVS